MPGAAADITLRPGLAADAPALARIHHAARRQALPGLAEPWTEAEVAAWLADVLIARHQVRVAAAAGGQPVGYIGFDAGEGQLLHLYIAPDWQRRGLGNRLIGVAKAASPRGLALFAFRRNHAACRFYEGHGFRATVRRDAAANEEGEPDVHYVWTPDPVTDPRGANA